MRLTTALFLGTFLLSGLASATPINVAGFTFATGETAFADDAFLLSGSGVRHTCTAGGTAASSLAEALSGSDLTQCANVSGGGDGIVEVLFLDNSIVNNAGTDLVIFEVSGPQSPGTGDARERFEVSVFDGTSFSAFASEIPIATGFGTPDPTLDVFAVEIELSAFGIAPGNLVDRVRLHLFDNGLGSKGADIAALGALNSGYPIPEPETVLLLALGLSLLAVARRTRGVPNGGSSGTVGHARFLEPLWSDLQEMKAARDGRRGSGVGNHRGEYPLIGPSWGASHGRWESVSSP